MNEFYEIKCIRREFNVARTPQQNGVAERKDMILIEVAKTMLADSKLSTTFWAKAINTTCYIQNRVLVIKPHNKTPCELFLGRKPTLSFMRPFWCLVKILNTLDRLGKFDEKSDDGFFVGYSINSKAFRVFNTRTKFIEENMHISFLENKQNVAGIGPNWMFDIDTLTMSMNYQPVFLGNQTNGNTGTKANINSGQAGKKTVFGLQYVLLPLLTYDSQGPKSLEDKVADGGKKRRERAQRNEFESMFRQDKDANGNMMFTPVSDAGSTYINLGGSIPVNAATLLNADLPTDPLIPDLEDTAIMILESLVVHMKMKLRDHPKEQIIEDLLSAPQTKRMTKTSQEHAMLDRGMQDELLQFRLQKLEIKQELVAQGYTKEEGIDYNEVFAPLARIRAIWLFLAYASFMGFIVYQMGVKSAFLFGTIEEELYVMQRDDRIFISQDKYVDDILKKFDFSLVNIASTPIETNKALLKDEEAKDVDVHLYISMIGSLMYLTASRPDIMFAVYTCARFQVTPNALHLHVVKRFFRYLKGQPKLGLWYPRDSPFDLEAFSDNDYARVSLDKKSTTGGCQFLRNRLISWQCKK
nr:ribonuclease H-like domain-containing protein [Tanacetum cinerariifolium]